MAKNKPQYLQAPSFYGVLGLKIGVDQSSLKFDYPDADKVRRAWRECVADSHPETASTVEERDRKERRFRSVMEAYGTLYNPSSCGEYRAYLEADGGKHEAWLKSDDRRPFVSPVEPCAVILLRDSLADAMAAEGEDALQRSEGVSVVGLPRFLAGEALREVKGLESLDVWSILDEVVRDYRDHFPRLAAWLHDHPEGIGWTWRRDPWKSKGRVAIGHSRRVSDRDRARMNGAGGAPPYGTLDIALSWWMAATHDERRRMIFHELNHFEVVDLRLRVVAHDVEAFAAEVAAFGVTSPEVAEVVVEALRREDTPERLAEFGFLGGDQLRLFEGMASGLRGESSAA